MREKQASVESCEGPRVKGALPDAELGFGFLVFSVFVLS